jgi:hypothetical protein
MRHNPGSVIPENAESRHVNARFCHQPMFAGDTAIFRVDEEKPNDNNVSSPYTMPDLEFRILIQVSSSFGLANLGIRS